MLPEDRRHDDEHAILPYSAWCEQPQPILYELADGRFQLMERTPPSPFMAGSGFLLVERALAEFLREQGLERVRIEPAVLYDRATGAEYHEHRRVRVGQCFTHDQIHDLALEGPRLLVMDDEYCFVTEDLMLRLRAAGFPYLRFERGLAWFG